MRSLLGNLFQWFLVTWWVAVVAILLLLPFLNFYQLHWSVAGMTLLCIGTVIVYLYKGRKIYSRAIIAIQWIVITVVPFLILIDAITQTVAYSFEGLLLLVTMGLAFVVLGEIRGTLLREVYSTK